MVELNNNLIINIFLFFLFQKASSNGIVGVVIPLVSHGANINAANKKGETALWKCIKHIYYLKNKQNIN